MNLSSLPLLSILTVNKNGGLYLNQALASACTFKPIWCEIICVDGLSDDNSHNIINSWIDYIDLFVCESDSCICEAFNKALLLASGKYIYFLNSDDYLTESFYDSVYPLLSNNNYDALYFSVYLNYAKSSSFPLILPRIKYFSNNVLSIMPCSHQGSIIRRETYLELNSFNCSYPTAFDYEFFIRLHLSIYSFKIFSFPIAYYRYGGISNSPRSYFQNYLIHSAFSVPLFERFLRLTKSLMIFYYLSLRSFLFKS